MHDITFPLMDGMSLILLYYLSFSYVLFAFILKIIYKLFKHPHTYTHVFNFKIIKYQIEI